MVTFMKELGEVWRCAGLFRAREYERIGIGMWQDSCLLAVCETPGVSQEEIAARIYLHKSNVARQLGSLEERGFVTRDTDRNDKRVLRVYPTQKAYEAMPAIRGVREEWNRRVLDGFGDKEKEALVRLLQKLSENAKCAAANRGGNA